METTESTLIARLKRGDPEAFDVVYARWRARIFSFLVRQIGDRPSAEDALQETFLRLAAHRARLRDDTDVGAWLFTVARHLAVSHGRWRSVTKWALGVLQRTAESPRASPPTENLASSESMARLENALTALPGPYREVLLLVAVDGLEPARAAAVIGVRPDALRKRLSRARAMLSLALVDEPAAPVLILHRGKRR
ncbi:MAG TPA: RNA polymerase sigma factor [Polyangiaceae bacterium]|nr:RNA polymerase sigma factor [Polyangiaceae bacterium]